MDPNQNNSNQPNAGPPQPPPQETQTQPTSDGVVQSHTPIVIQPTNLDQNPPTNQPEITQPMQSATTDPAQQTQPQATQGAMQQTLNPMPAQQPVQQMGQQLVSPQPTGQPFSSIPQATDAMSQQGPAPMPLGATKSRKSLLFGGIALFAILVLGTLGFVFAVYLPNTPENVWKTGLSRTGDEVRATVDKLADPATFDNLTKNTLDIDGELTMRGGKYNMTFDSNYDQTQTENTLNVKMSGEDLPQDIDLTANIKTNLVENSVWPNAYFKLAGLSSIGADGFFPGISAYENRWIAIEQDYYKENFGEYLNNDDVAQENITQQDVVSIINDITVVADEYLFTADPEKAVLNLDEFVGQEESQGLTAYHYKVSINQMNASAMCSALADALIDNDAYRKIYSVTDEDKEQKRSDFKEDCEITEEDTAEVQNFDLWMDKKYKLFHKARFYEDLEKKAEKLRENKTECEERYSNSEFSSGASFCDYYDDAIETGERYFEFGQIYDGADQLNLFIGWISSTDRSTYTLTGNMLIDINSLSYKGGFAYENTSNADNQMKATVTVDTQPFDGEIDATRPADAIDLQTVMDEIMAQQQQRYSSNQYQFEELGITTDDTLLGDGFSDPLTPIIELLQSIGMY